MTKSQASIELKRGLMFSKKLDDLKLLMRQFMTNKLALTALNRMEYYMELKWLRLSVGI